MTLKANIDLVPYQPEFGWALVLLWREAFQQAMGLPLDNPLSAVQDQLAYWRTIDPALTTVAIDPSTSELAGFMVLHDQELEHLYISTAYQGLGLGKRFLEQAKVQSPNELRLYTFQANLRAQRFYLSQGFTEIGRGEAAAEDNPWATDPAQLKDIRYTWRPA